MPFNNYHFNVSQFKCPCFKFTAPHPCDRPRSTKSSLMDTRFFCPNLSTHTTTSANILFPSQTGEQKCTLVKVTNLAEPDWMNVNCHDKLLPSTLCHHHKIQEKTTTTEVNVESIKMRQVCSAWTIRIHLKCYFFKWIDNNRTILHRNVEGDKTLQTITLPELKMIKEIFQCTQANYPVLMTQGEHDTLMVMFTCTKLFILHTCRLQSTSKNPPPGYQVFRKKEIDIRSGPHIFTCEKGGHITVLSRCDGKPDCPNDQSDEENCACSERDQYHQATSCQTFVSGTQHACGPLFYTTKHNKCVLYISNNTKFPTYHQVNCHNTSTQPTVFDWVIEWRQSDPCSVSMEIPCRDGHSNCFNISDICSFSLNGCGKLHPCRNGGHMEDCKSFDCSNSFKCLYSYCIPWTYVCDSKWDCPQGEDEMFYHVCGTTEPTCEHMFKCWNASLCIHFASVCDKIVHCPFGDDEKLCQLRSIICPQQCTCLAMAINCTQDHQELIHYPFVAIQMASCLKIIQYLHKFVSCAFLTICHSKISEKHMQFPTSLLQMDLQHNLLGKTLKISFSGGKSKLKKIVLSNNRIQVLYSHSFSNLYSLIFVALSCNPLVNLPANLFSSSPCLKYLSVLNITLLYVDVDAFKLVKVKIIKATDYKLCCMKPFSSVCTAQTPWFQSCNDLLEQSSIQVSFLVVSTIVFVVNVLSLVVHTFGMTKANQAYSAMTIASNMCNLLLVQYSGTLWVADNIFKGTFFAKGSLWTSGVTCFTIFVFALLFTLASQTLTLLLSVSRMMVVICPFDSNFKMRSFVVKIISNVTVAFIFCSVLVTLLLKAVHGEIVTKFCFPLFNPTSVVFMTVLLQMLVSLQFLSTISMVIMHAVIFHTMMSQPNLKQSTQKDATSLFVQLGLISFSAGLCWLPSNAIFIAAHCLQTYPIQLIPWTMITIIPLNSIFIPLVLSSFVFKKFWSVKQVHTKKAIQA